MRESLRIREEICKEVEMSREVEKENKIPGKIF